MKDMLTVTLKAKMAGFDNACMHGSDRDLMHFFTLHLEKVGNAWGTVAAA